MGQIKMSTPHSYSTSVHNIGLSGTVWPQYTTRQAKRQSERNRPPCYSIVGLKLVSVPLVTVVLNKASPVEIFLIDLLEGVQRKFSQKNLPAISAISYLEADVNENGYTGRQLERLAQDMSAIYYVGGPCPGRGEGGFD